VQNRDQTTVHSSTLIIHAPTLCVVEFGRHACPRAFRRADLGRRRGRLHDRPLRLNRSSSAVDGGSEVPTALATRVPK